MQKTRLPSDQVDREILITMLALSLIPSQLEGQHRLHLLSAAEYLAHKGPSILTTENPFDRSILMHIHLYYGYASIARRKGSVFHGLQWKNVPAMIIYPIPEFPAASRYIPRFQTDAEFATIAM